MEDGFYWYKAYTTKNQWEVCQVRTDPFAIRWVDFFGQCSQKLGNEWMAGCVTFGDKIAMPDEAERKSK